jgi:hypothetical protein
MARRKYHSTPKGKLYCVEWPEWHVECANPNCDNAHMVAALGEASTAAEAERRALGDSKRGKADGWVCLKGLWYCPACKPKPTA